MDKNLTAGEQMQVDTAPDDLAHGQEVGQHRFTMFTKAGDYAYARGLEISPAHLPRALDAMLVDGWELVSLFGQTDAKHVGFVFRWVGANPRVQGLLEANTELVLKNRELQEKYKELKFRMDGPEPARARVARSEHGARPEEPGVEDCDAGVRGQGRRW